MTKLYSLRLAEIELGQIIDGLRMREESWRKTSDYYAGKTAADFIIEECSGKEEAERMADCYSAIIANICEQRDAQS